MSKKLEIGQALTGTITDLSHIGEGILHVEGFPVFIVDALPGETVTFKIVHVGQRRAVAELLEIIEESSDRVDVPNDLVTASGTMPLRHLAYPAQLDFKRAQVRKLFRNIAKLPDVEVRPVIGMEDPYHYRNKAQIPVREVDGELSTGFYKRGTHELLPVEDFVIQEPAIDEAILTVRNILREVGVSAYDEEEHAGDVRHLIVRRGHYTEEVMVILVTNSWKLPHVQEIIARMREEIPHLVSVVQNINDRRTNVILGKQSMVLFGQPTYTDRLGDFTYHIAPVSFYQVNSVQTEKLYQEALRAANLTGTETVIDAYCGIGTMTLPLAKRARHVYGVEIVPEAIQNAEDNAKMNGVENVTFATADAPEWMVRQKNDGLKADVIVVDPPRKGLERKFIAAALATAPERIVYVSCNPATLARDVREFTKDDEYCVEYVQPVDMFPQTTHVESVVLIIKK